MRKHHVEITAVWLRNVGETLIVEVEIDGVMIPAISEYVGKMEFSVSHIVEGSKIYDNAKRKAAGLVKQ